MEIKSSAEIKVLKFVTCYGAETLIFWLDSFDKVITSKEYPLYRNLEREVCRAFGISYADMQRTSSRTAINAKRLISFLAFHHYHICVATLSKLLSISERTVNYYLNDTEGWINQPRAYQSFVDIYNQVIQRIKI
jgi:hypothetical protein